MSAWMLYAVAVAALFGMAAWAAERALVLYRRPARVMWILASLASVVVPVVAALVPPAPAAAPATGRPVVLTGVQAIERVGAATVSLDLALVIAWVVMSALLAAWLGLSYRRLKREQAQWSRTVVEGMPVFVSPDVGPAVFDPIAGSIVVPRWLLDVSPAERRLALEHERAHVTAGDARLVWLGMLLVVAMPWNPVLWWQLHRLRAAVELDCDRRVLAGGAAPSAYATLLLSMGQGRGASLLRPALIEPQTLLGWRISAMIEQRIRARLARTVVYGALAVGLFFVACDAPAPQHPEDTALDDQPSAERFDPAAYDGAVAEAAVDEVPERLSCPLVGYPPMLREAGIEGTVKTRFVVGMDGTVVPNSVIIVDSDHRAFEAPVRDMITRCRFTPARLEGNAVNVDVEMPVSFALAASRHDESSKAIRVTGTPAAAETSLVFVRRYDRSAIDVTANDEGVTVSAAVPPLYVVDGVIIAADLDLDTLDVQTIEVVSGQAAFVAYGDRAGNGVIRITTKKN